MFLNPLCSTTRILYCQGLPNNMWLVPLELHHITPHFVLVSSIFLEDWYLPNSFPFGNDELYWSFHPFALVLPPFKAGIGEVVGVVVVLATSERTIGLYPPYIGTIACSFPLVQSIILLM